jgi:two-component system nitrate/nitrite response regulator NarP
MLKQGVYVKEDTQENPIRLVLLGGQSLFRAALGRLLASKPGLEVVAECDNSVEALAVLSVSPVDVVLLDSGNATEGADGFLSAARRNGFQGRFLIIAEAVDACNLASVIRLGASGIFLKSEAPERLVQAIKLVANGAVWFDQEIVRLLADQSMGRLDQPDSQGSANPLPERDAKVLHAILQGLTNRRIAQHLGLSEGCVKGAVQRLFRRTGARTRSQFVRAVLEGSLGKDMGLTKPARNTAAAQLASSASRLPPLLTGNVSIRRQSNG